MDLDIGKVITTIIAVVVAGILVGALLPTAVNSNTRSTTANSTYIGGANLTNWVNGSSAGVAQSATWDAIPIMIVVSALLVFVMIVIKLSG